MKKKTQLIVVLVAALAAIVLLVGCNPNDLDVEVTVDFYNVTTASKVSFTNGTDSVHFASSEGNLVVKTVPPTFTTTIFQAGVAQCAHFLTPETENWSLHVPMTGGQDTTVQMVEPYYKAFESCR
jgi:hypothetical protein